MENVAWGLYMTAAGMGTVFLLLLALMTVLMLVGRLDVASPPAPAPPAEAGDAGAGLPLVQEPADAPPVGGLSPDLVAAITIAVITHARVRRGQAAPAMRRAAPGSQLFASRWVSVGRSYQNRPWK